MMRTLNIHTLHTHIQGHLLLHSDNSAIVDSVLFVLFPFKCLMHLCRTKGYLLDIITTVIQWRSDDTEWCMDYRDKIVSDIGVG